MITLLGKYLRKARIDLDLSLRELADQIGISPAQLSAIETGKRDAKTDVIDKMANAIGISSNKEREYFEQIAIRSNSEVSFKVRDLNEATANTVTLLARHAGKLKPETVQKIEQLALEDLEME